MRLLPADPDPDLIVYSDGAARGNPGPAAIGVYITDAKGREIATVARGIGPNTNNVAEYSAAIEGLRVAADRGAKRVILRSDSRLLVQQLLGRFKVKAPALKILHAQAREQLRRFEHARIEHIPREMNTDADRMANQGVDEWLAGEGAGYTAPGPDPQLFEGGTYTDD